MSQQIDKNIKRELKSFKDIESIDELDFDKIELIRGATPPDIQQKCLQLCKDYLSGNWSQQTINTIEVRRITGGLINQLYYCGIKSPNVDNQEVCPQEVAIRLYGQNILDPEDGRIRDVVIALMFSENNLGPKLYGLFEEGQIQKFYKHKQFFGELQNNSQLVRKVMQTLAKIHSLEAPIKKQSEYLLKLVIKTYEEAFQKYPILDEIEENNCKTLMNNDLRTEINWITDVIRKSKSPVLFTHNDFRSSNLMITEPNDELVICDYDISCYGYRGFDFSGLMREWGRKQFEMISIENLAINDEFRPLIEIYVEECLRIHGKSYSENPINSVDHILKEAKTFQLFSYLFFTVFSLKNEESDFPVSRKVILGFAETSFKNYFKIKEILRKQQIIE